MRLFELGQAAGPKNRTDLIHLADTYQVASCLADTKEAQACLLNQKSDGVFFTPKIYRGHTAKIYRGRVGVGVARLARLIFAT